MSKELSCRQQENKVSRKTQSCLQKHHFSQTTSQRTEKKLQLHKAAPQGRGKSHGGAAGRALSPPGVPPPSEVPSCFGLLPLAYPMDWGAQLRRHVPPVRTWACHFLQKPPAPLKVGTPLSALTPAPVMMAICFALANTSRKSAISMRGKENKLQALTLSYKRPYSDGKLRHPEMASTYSSHDLNFRILIRLRVAVGILEFEGQFLEVLENVYQQAQWGNMCIKLWIYSIFGRQSL